MVPWDLWATETEIWSFPAYAYLATIHIFAGAALETYLYAILVTLAIACASLIGARYEERGLPLA